MGDHLLPFLPDYRAMILSRHGALTWGEDLQEAYNGMERLEHAAQVLALAQQLGGLTSLPEEEVRHLRAVRKKMGKKTL
jgi:L-fuculose-phosphate aldolase